jgi:hypothetical protein
MWEGETCRENRTDGLLKQETKLDVAGQPLTFEGHVPGSDCTAAERMAGNIGLKATECREE